MLGWCESFVGIGCAGEVDDSRGSCDVIVSVVVVVVSRAGDER